MKPIVIYKQNNGLFPYLMHPRFISFLLFKRTLLNNERFCIYLFYPP
jgi:hypothetical protein